MKQIFLIQYRRGVGIALWQVPAPSYEQALFQMRLLEEHQSGDTYVEVKR